MTSAEGRMGKGEARLRVESVRARPALVRRAAARQAFARAGGAGELTRRAVDAVEALLGGGSGREAALGGGVVARRSYGEVRFGKGGRGAAPRVSVALAVPGRVEVPEVGLWVEAQVVNAECRMTNDESMPDDECRMPSRGEAWSLPLVACGRDQRGDRQSRSRRSRGPWEEVIDLDAAGERLVVRTRRAGDRFVPLGLGAPKKLKDFFVDERVPREERERVLVVEGRSGIVWVVGLRLDERAKVGPQTRRFARLRAGTLEGGVFTAENAEDAERRTGEAPRAARRRAARGHEKAPRHQPRAPG